MKRKLYRAALYIAAEQLYNSEVVETGMESSLIGEDGYFVDRKEWITMQVESWLEQAEIESDHE